MCTAPVALRGEATGRAPPTVSRGTWYRPIAPRDGCTLRVQYREAQACTRSSIPRDLQRPVSPRTRSSPDEPSPVPHEDGGNVQQPVAERLRLGLFELAVEAGHLRPGDERPGDETGGPYRPLIGHSPSSRTAPTSCLQGGTFAMLEDSEMSRLADRVAQDRPSQREARTRIWTQSSTKRCSLLTSSPLLSTPRAQPPL